MLQDFAQGGQQLHRRELEMAFSHFNQASDYLTEVFRELETRVSSLNSELSHVRDETQSAAGRKKRDSPAACRTSWQYYRQV